MSTFYYSNSEARKKIKKMEEIMGEKTYGKFYAEPSPGVYEDISRVSILNSMYGLGSKDKIMSQMSAVDDSRVWGNPCDECISNLYPSLHPGSNLVAGKVQSMEISPNSTFQAYVEVDCNLTNDLYNFIMGNICDSGKENNMKNLKIKKVVFNPPATIVFWSDNTKTVVKSSNELYDGEKGLAMAIAKKFLGTNDTKSNYYDEFRKWLKDAPDCTNCKYDDTCESTSYPCWSCTDNYSNFERKDD